MSRFLPCPQMNSLWKEKKDHMRKINPSLLRGGLEGVFTGGENPLNDMSEGAGFDRSIRLDACTHLAQWLLKTNVSNLCRCGEERILLYNYVINLRRKIHVASFWNTPETKNRNSTQSDLGIKEFKPPAKQKRTQKSRNWKERDKSNCFSCSFRVGFSHSVYNASFIFIRKLEANVR